jgi:hypothetical protein
MWLQTQQVCNNSRVRSNQHIRDESMPLKGDTHWGDGRGIINAMAEWMPKANIAVDLRRLALSVEEMLVFFHLDGRTATSQLPELTGLPLDRIQRILEVLGARGALHGVSLTPGALPSRDPCPLPPNPCPGDSAGPPEQPVPALSRAEASEVDLPEPPLLELSSAEAVEPEESEKIEPEEPGEAQYDYRRLFETKLHLLSEEERKQLALTVLDPELSAFCFDPLPAVIKAVVANPATGLKHARLIARHHGTPLGLEAMCARIGFAQDPGVRHWLVRNQQLPERLFRTFWSNQRMSLLYRLERSWDLPDGTRRAANKLLRQRFLTGLADEKADLIIKTDGRILRSLTGLPIDSRTVALLCGRLYGSTLLIMSIAQWSTAPKALIGHLLKQELVLHQPQLQRMLQRHPNAPKDGLKKKR